MGIWIMQISFSNNSLSLFMLLPDFQPYLVNWALNRQHAQINNAIRIHSWWISPWECRELFTWVFISFSVCKIWCSACLPTQYQLRQLWHLQKQHVRIWSILKCVVKKRTPFLLDPSVISIASLLLSAHWSWAGCYQSTEANHQHLVWLSQADLCHDRPRPSLFLWQSEILSHIHQLKSIWRPLFAPLHC